MLLFTVLAATQGKLHRSGLCQMVRRHAPIDLVRPRRPGEGREAPTKVCPECDSILALSASECPDCGHEFTAREVKIAPAAAALSILTSSTSD